MSLYPKDYAYGVIPLMKYEDIRHTILVHLASGNHRWLPKWHMEIGETPLQSAIRELSEETGLSIDSSQIDTSIIYEDQYHCFSHGQEVDKTVIYYTAQLPYTDVMKLSGYSEWDGEIFGKKIINLTDAIDLATYEGTKDILRQVNERVEKIDSN